MKNTTAVIDIGSNTVRLVVFDLTDGYPMPLFDEGAFCALGRGVGKSGKLTEDSFERALEAIGRFTDLVREFFQAFVHNARINLHADLLHGDNAHHQIEALFKATALALRKAVRRDGALQEMPSTKGTIE